VRSQAITVLLAGVLSACSLGGVQAEAAGAGAEQELQRAVADAPYRVRLPGALPDGFTMQRIDWIDQPDDPARHGFSIDVRYSREDGTTVHVFQTNVSAEEMGETDPVTLADGRPLTIDGAEWTAVTLPNGDGTWNIQIARRIGDITLTIDAPSVELVEAAARSLAEVDR
jgi:hypothetical protein